MKLLMLSIVLISGFAGDPVEEFSKINKSYTERKKNMHLVMEIERKANCVSSESEKERVEYFYLNNDLYAKSENWEILLSGDDFIQVDHINRMILMSKKNAEEIRKLGEIGNLNQFSELIQKHAKTSTSSVGDLKQITLLPDFGEYAKIELRYTSDYQIKSLNMQGRKASEGGYFNAKESYCMNLDFVKEEYGTCPSANFRLSKYIVKTSKGYETSSQFKNYKLAV